jgi:hypothetical protein
LIREARAVGGHILVTQDSKTGVPGSAKNALSGDFF